MANEAKNGVVSQDTTEGLVRTESEFPLVSFPQDDSLIDVSQEIAQVEKDIETFKKIQRISLRLTTAKDWLVQGEGLYMMDSGAEKLAIAWGIHIAIEGRPIQEWQEDEDGRYYQFIVKGKAYSRKLGRYVEDFGTCSQRDKFFGKKGGEWKEQKDVDINMIRKKAITNLYNRIIKRTAGLLSITDEDLKAAGVDLGSVAKVEYKGGSQKASAAMSKEAGEKRKRIWNICLSLANGNDEDAVFILGELSKFKGSDGAEKMVTDINKLTSEKWINTILGAAEKRYAEFDPESYKEYRAQRDADKKGGAK